MPEATTSNQQVIQENAIDQLIGNPIISLVIKVVFAVGLVFVLVIVSKMIASWVRRRVLHYAGDKDEAQVTQVASLIHDMVYYSLIIFAFFVGFQVLGFDVGLILWWISLGLWLAFKEVLGNMIAGIMLLTNKEIKLGDIVQIDIDGTTSYFGRMEEINLRFSVLRTFELKQIILPNMVLINSAMQTYSAEEVIRLETIVQVHYDSDLDFATNVFTAAVNSCSCVITPEKTRVLTENLGESGIDMRCMFYVNPNSWLLIEQIMGMVNERIMNYAKANGIRIPYPHTTLTMNWKDPMLLQGINELVMNTKSTPRPIINAESSPITKPNEANNMASSNSTGQSVDQTTSTS